jgi:phenylalanyl-tRNA synthetase beta chain
MPKIEVNEKLFFSLLGRRPDRETLIRELEGAKAELDEWVEGPGDGEDRVLKIELNDTNRPDLWSTAGLARQLASLSGAGRRTYGFFSREGDSLESSYRVVVDPSASEVRPYIAAFVVSGKPLSDAALRDVIQTQEKLCWNFGRKRRSVAMGVYRSTLIRFPVRYKAVPPSTKMHALGSESESTLSQILASHPKGKEFAFILDGAGSYPFLVDEAAQPLSFPPIINSAKLGAVEVGDTDLFVELTGTDLPSLALAANIVACDFADSGYEIKPVRVEYPYDTPFGRSITFPYYFQTPVSVDSGKVGKLLGRSFSPEAVRAALDRVGCASDGHGSYVTVFPPEYRNDFLHPVDIVEDVAIGSGLSSFEPERPRDFTVGRLHPIERVSRRVVDVFTGLGYQEMIYNYLGAGRDFFERMRLDPSKGVRIANPMSENYEYVRPSVLPSLLQSEAISAKAPYPHRAFEVGRTCVLDSGRNSGTLTRQRLGFLSSHGDANFNEAASVVATFAYYMDGEYQVEESEDPRFIPGRQAALLWKGARVGVFGEVHPEVLEAWGIGMPCIAGELDAEAFIG